MLFLFKDHKINPKLGLISVFLLITTVLMSLGIWQLQRAKEKRAIEAATSEQNNDSLLWIGDPLLDEIDNEYQKGAAQGYFDNKHTMLLDNQIYQGRAGYYVLTPLRLANSKKGLLINRGWVPASLYREKLPQVEDASSLLITVHGILHRPSNPPFFLGEKESLDSAGWPKLVQYMDLNKLQFKIGYSLQPLILQLALNEPYGFTRPWLSSTPVIGSQRHIAYAIQWFTMSVIAVIVFVVLYRREFSNKK
ncbi:SURF1 family protein [Candidatus Nitrosoglobus terrae]|nr:SURF1 family protein [Candidatus Nitrosoglobus terrae]